MGHHVKRGSTSTLIYSRQYYINLCGKLLAMYQAIREGRFSPDLDVSQRVMSVADSIRPDARADAEPVREEPREQEPVEDSSVSGESEAEHSLLTCAQSSVCFSWDAAQMSSGCTGCQASCIG